MTLIWALNYIAAKVAVRSFPPLLVGPLRALFAAVVLLPVFLLSRKGRADHDSWSRRDLLQVGVLGIFGITLNQVLFVVGMQRTSVAHAALMIAMSPLLVLTMAALKGQERFTQRKLAGIGTSIAGIAALNLVPGKGAQGASLSGDLWVFLASFSFALYTVYGKELAHRHDSLTMNTLGYIAGAGAGLPLLIPQSMGFNFASVPAAGWWALAYMAVLSSVVCYLIFYYALRWMPASRISAFSYSQPVIASLAGLALLNEPVTLNVIVGGLLVLAGVWLVGRK
jgi:drug/metabolite transporter (DMT)-like permease